MAHLYLAAPQKSSGKTTLAVGLCRAFRDLGLVVQPFKKGPDYIDPLWLSQAAGRACYNLDFHTMDRAEIAAAFGRELSAADLGLIEGNVGLFDDTHPAGINSNAELAKLLSAPVILVVNCQGMGRGIAPLLLGYQSFDPGLRLAGVILNKVGGSRHGSNLLGAVERYTDLPVLGVLGRDETIGIVERHLGLMPSNETAESERWVEKIRRSVSEQVDLQRLLAIAERAARPAAVLESAGADPMTATPLRIGVARDAAFGFYYPDDLRALAAGGAELVPFSPLADPELPSVDGLFMGGGFPEYRMAELEANRSLRQSIAEFVADGGPTYAECGGLMYLCEGLRWNGERRAMVGALAAEVEMRDTAQGRGYVRLRETADFPWPRMRGLDEIPAHEFHHSAVVQPHPDWVYGYQVLRGTGVNGSHDGIVQGNLFASYSHLRDVGGVHWTARFLAHVRRCAGG